MSVVVLRADAVLAGDAVVAPGEVAFSEETGEILYVGEGPAPQLAEGAELRQLPGRVLMPGLVNGHTHSAMTLLRGVQDDAGFMPWLAEVQALEQHLTHEDVRTGLELALVEMIESGTVLFADMYHWDEELVEVVRAAGLRGHLAVASFAPGVVGFPGVSPHDGTAALAATEQLARRYAGDSQVRIAFGPHAPYTCPPEFLREVRDRALAGGIPVHIHVSESLAEVEQITAQYGCTPGEHLASLGLYDAEVLAAHCVHITESEIATFAAAGVAVSHNPVSNLKLGCGVARLPEWLAAGLRVTIGTDSVASNNTLDLFEEIKLATILHRGVRHDAAAIRAADVLRLATRGGAAALGFGPADVAAPSPASYAAAAGPATGCDSAGGPAATGLLAPGWAADIIALDVTTASSTPLDLVSEPESLISHLAFAASGSDVREVYVGGRHLYSEGRHLTLDAPAIRAKAATARARLRRQAREAQEAQEPAAQ